VYLRLAREKTPLMTTSKTPFVFGKDFDRDVERRRPEVAVFATGPLLYNALIAAKELAEKYFSVLYNVHTIKPLDTEAVIKVAKKLKRW
jgi:transketolase